MENTNETAKSIGALLKDSRAEDVCVLDMRKSSVLADFFIIATVNSATHIKGLEKHIAEYAKQHQLHPYQTRRKGNDGNEWKALDLGTIVVHLMNPTARKFYDLEKLWYESPNILAEE